MDGALIANEIVNWLKRKRKPRVLLKLDFQKAYDTIDWNSLNTVMEEMGFGRRWRGWIQSCLTSATISILLNGTPCKPFKMGRGLRQGDPLSPFLFVIMAEVLNKMLTNATQLRFFKGLEVGVKEVKISHLQFADDTLIFSEVEEEYLENIKRILLSFQTFSGLTMNYKKSGLIVLRRNDAWAQNAAVRMGWTLVKLPITYLSLIHI